MPKSREGNPLDNQRKPSAFAQQLRGSSRYLVVVLIAAVILLPFEFEGVERWLDSNEGVVVGISTIFLAVFTWRLVVTTRLLWEAGQNQLAHAKESSERQLRAYVFPHTAQLNIKPLPDGIHCIIEGSVQILNSGQTPAYDFTSWIGTGVTENPYLGNFPPPDPLPRDRSIVGPGTTQMLDSDRTYPISALDDIRNSRSKVYVFGEVEYTDAFKTRRCVRFRFQCAGPEIDRCILKSCEEGNEEITLN